MASGSREPGSATTQPVWQPRVLVLLLLSSLLVLTATQRANASHFDGAYAGVVNGANANIQFTITGTTVYITQPFDSDVQCDISHADGTQVGNCEGTFGGCQVSLYNGRVRVNADGTATASGSWRSDDCFAEGTWNAQRAAAPFPGPAPAPGGGGGVVRPCGDAPQIGDNTPANQPDLRIRRGQDPWRFDNSYAGAAGFDELFVPIVGPVGRPRWPNDRRVQFDVRVQNDGPCVETFRVLVPFWKPRTVTLGPGQISRAWGWWRDFTGRNGRWRNCATAVPTLRSVNQFPSPYDKVCALVNIF
ncbi:MAG: hypothetical protein ACRD1T_13325 [Acidimicrobiia bacterium]